MVKILKKSKKPISTHPQVNAIILAIQDAPDHDLPAILDAVSYWHWPRTDLHYWIKPLNRFDSILEEICKNYNVKEGQIQVNEFTPRTKELILAIIRFSRLLLENATNRKLYSSFDRMNDLLLTQDLDILEAALRLIFRRAQQIAANGPIASGETFNLTPRRVLDLTFGWKPVRKAGLSMLDLVKEQIDVAAVRNIEEVSFQFYRKASASTTAVSTKESNTVADGIAATPAATPAAKSIAKSSKPTPAGPSTPSTSLGQTSLKGHASDFDQEGMTTIHLGNVAVSGRNATDVLIDTMEQHRVPQEEKIRLLERIRVGMAIGNVTGRRQLLRIRLLAVGVLIHTSPDSTAESEIFLHEPDFISQLADLVQPSKPVPMDVRTVALLALDTCCRVDNRVNDVTSALSVSVNHGTLMSILRKLASDLHSDHPETTSEYVDALFSFLTYLQTAQHAGNMLHGAGAIPLLIDLVKETRLSHDALLVANRAVTFLDNFTYSFPNASGPFATAGGLQVFVERVRQLVAAGVAVSDSHRSMAAETASPLLQPNDPGTLSYGESTLLKSLFRCLQRLMNSGQNTEGVRQLIDSSLVESCKLVMKHRLAFGPQNFALAVTIMLTFVHNEPTSLTVLQEKKVPDVFYEAIRGDIEPSLDVLSVIPTAIGALCLNEAGLNQFQSQCLDIFNKFFSTFLSEKHARILNERENAVIIGANFDELVRHHPSLKQSVLEAITSLLKNIYEDGKDYVPETAEGYRLQLATDDKPPRAPLESASTAGNEVGNANPFVQGTNSTDVSMSEQPGPVEAAAEPEPKREDNRLLASVAVTGRFLEGFFTTPAHCKDYIKKDGLDYLLRLFTLPCIPFDIHHHAPYPGLTTVFLSISESSSDHLLKALLNQAKETFGEMQDFWEPENPAEQPVDTLKLELKIKDMLEPKTTEALEAANKTFRVLAKAQHILTIMSELHSTDNYVTRQPSSQILSILRSPERTKTIQDMCALFRACTFSAVKLKGMMPAPNHPQSSSAASGTSATADVSGDAVLQAGNAGEPSDVAMTSGPGADSNEPTNSSRASACSAGTVANAKALKTVLMTIPDSTKSFLQGIMSLHATRRSSVDNQHRKDATFVAHAIALGVAQNLRWLESNDASANFEYATLMTKLLVDLLQMERSTVGGLHLIFLKALDKQEGTDRLIALHARYVAEVAELSRIPEVERDAASRLRLIHAIGGLKVVLNVFETLTSHRFLLSAGHLLLLTQDRNSQSFFDPYAFLVKLRCRILPSVSSTWDANFLASSPPIIVRAVFRILLQILEAQGETGDTDIAGPFTSVPVRTQTIASPTLVQSLVDMGFPRSACEQALVRRNNNLATAADYLMTHPEVVAAARAREEQDAGNAQDAAPAGESQASQENPLGTGSEGRSTPMDVDMTDASSGRGTPLPATTVEGENAENASQAEPSNKSKSGTRKYTKADLDALRDQLKTTFISRALTLAQDHGELVFDIRQALKTIDFKPLGPQTYDTSRGLNGILQELSDRLANGLPSTPEEDRGVAARMRLVALIFADPMYRRAADTSYAKAMQSAMQLVNGYNSRPSDGDARPKWLSSTMLVSELILSRSELPKEIDTVDDIEENSALDMEAIVRGPAFTTEREALFSLSLDVLKKGVTNDRDLLQSTLRMILMLTRQPTISQSFLEQGGLQALVQGFERGKRDTEGFQDFAVMILRHAVEDRATVKALMDSHIQTWLSKARKAVATESYVKDLNADACRNTQTFLELTADLCNLTSVPGGYGIVSKEEKLNDAQRTSSDNSQANQAEKSGKTEAGMQIDDLTKALPSSTPVSAGADSVMHFLIAEAVSATTAALESVSEETPVETAATVPPVGQASQLQAQAESVVRTGEVSADQTRPAIRSGNLDQPASQSFRDFTYASFLLACISELAASYTACKLSLLNWSKRKSDASTPHSKTGKWRSPFLNHLLTVVIPTGAPKLGKDIQARKRFALSTRAINVVISLCMDSNRNPYEPKSSLSSEITNIRKTVLDNLAKAFKEAETTSEHIDAKYGHLSALSVLCARLLAAPVPSGVNAAPSLAPNDMAMQMAKLMLEKSYASVLTNALSDVDFNHPDAVVLIDAILLPIEHLTNIVTKLNRTAGSDAPESSTTSTIAPPAIVSEALSSEDEEGESEDMEIEHEGEMDNEDDEDDRAASDVYRNSALGMFQGELEPANVDEQYSTDDEMDEDMEEWDDGVDDMMEEEGAVPSDVSDESENEEDMMDLAHDDVEEEIEDDEDVEDEGSSEDDNIDGHDDDEDNDEDDLEELDEVPASGIQADLAAALRNGHLEPVDDFTSRLINEQMDFFGEPAEGGMIQAHFGEDNRLPEDDNENLEEGDVPDDEDDESDEDDADDFDEGVDEQGNVAEMFDNLLGGHTGTSLSDPNVHVSVVGGSTAGERILSIDIGGPRKHRKPNNVDRANSSLPFLAPPAFGRRTAPRSNNPRHLGQHSLLTDSTEVTRRGGRGDFLGVTRHRHRAGRDGTEFTEWMQSLEDMIGNGASQLLEQVFGRMAPAGTAPPLPTIAPRSAIDSRSPVDLLQNLINGLNGRSGAGSRHRHNHQPENRSSPATIEMQIVNDVLSSSSASPANTSDRWSDESAIFSGGLQASERIAIIAKRVNAILLPEKRRRDQEQREKDEKEKAEREQNLPGADDKAAVTTSAEQAETQPAVNPSDDAEMTSVSTEPPTAAPNAASNLEQMATTAPQTPANSATPSGHGERLPWRERIERRRQAQVAPVVDMPSAANHPATPSLEAANTQQTPFAPAYGRDDLAEVLNLAARLSATDSAGPVTPGASASRAQQAGNDETMGREDGSASIEEVAANTEGATAQDQAPVDAQQAGDQAGTSDAVHRITIEVHGNTVDITDTGIDPTFLEALPDEMREEVLNQHFRETRAAAAPSTQAVPSSINTEFLDALPPELRAEVLAQEAMEAARARAAAAAAPASTATPGAGAGNDVNVAGSAAARAEADGEAATEPVEMDPVAFLASLDPHLRQTVLLEQGEEMLGALPPDMLEEYHAIRTREMREHGFRRHLGRRGDTNQLRMAGGPSGSRKGTPTIKRDAVQLLDKVGVAALIRLLFFPSPLQKNPLASILKHLCENSKTRVEIINLLLTVLHEGTRESGQGGETIDRTISTLTASGQTPASAGKGAKPQGKHKPHNPPTTPGFDANTPSTSYFPGLPHHLIASGPSDNIPQIAVQKALETLTHLVGSNETNATYFLTEQDLPFNIGAAKRTVPSGKRDKGKGRASEVTASKEIVYPIIVLFSLMSRKSLTDSPVIMEALTKLLASITLPLRNLESEKRTHIKSEQAGGDSSVVNGISTDQLQPVSTSGGDATVIPTAESSTSLKPPQLPPSYLRMVVHVLDLGDCSSKMFSAALVLIHHLWLLPDARAIIASELIALAQKYGAQLLKELAELKNSLAQKAATMSDQDSEVEVLRRFSQASSSQTKLLRVLKTIEYAKQQQSRSIKRRRALAERRKEEVESKKGDVPSEYEAILKEQEQSASIDATSGMDTENKERPKNEAIQLNYKRQLAKVEAELAQLKAEEDEEQHKVEELYTGFDFSPVWTGLSDCLTVMEQGSDVGSSAGTLLPLIEAFLMVSSWGLEGVDMNSVYHDTPSIKPANQVRASLSPLAHTVTI